ncbi:adipocyte plasma membrane-associated protein isoform X2 [Folsomia candida]|nr:adipocyte plasma membrane-associated protein isoform X2 [Folsomia candida]
MSPTNSILDKAEPLKLNREIIGPESIASRGDDLFTGLIYGDIIKINKDGKVTTVAKTGKECQGHHWDTKCGRPLGMRFHRGKLVVADGALGILRVDVDTGSIETLTPTGEIVDGKEMSFPDDLDVDTNGNIYYSDASTNGNMRSATLELFGEPSGRLLKYNAKTKKTEALLNGLHFPNGIQLSQNEDFVLVAEFMRARIIRYFLKGARKGEHEVFVDGLPGLPDNIRPNGRGGYYIGLFMPRYPYAKAGENLVDVLSDKPLLRKLIVRIQYLFLSLINTIEVFTGPDVLIDQVRSTVQLLGSNPENMEVPKKSIVTEIDGNGKIIKHLENKIGGAIAISEVHVGPTFTYFGTAVKKTIWKIKTKDLQ